jgi:chromatin modification-related protein YNG2
VTLTTTHVTQQKSRLSRQIRPLVEDLDMDADGDDDAEEEIEDETLYCFCQKQSYGDVSICYRRCMIFFV